jgi:hypothetical protein
MILIQEKIIFVHIPKTGGTSIENYLLKQFGYGRGFLTLTDGFYRGFDSSEETLIPYPAMHTPLYLIETMLKHNKIKVDNTWKIFSIVRNPYDRFISELFFTSYLPVLWHYHTLSKFDQKYLINYCIDLYWEHENNKNYHSNHSIPQYKFFEKTQLIPQIFQYESGFKNILAELDLYQDDKIPRFLDLFEAQNIPKLKSYKEAYTKILVQCVNEKYSEDFKKYDYEMLDPLLFD